jgi:hypothetical protein
MRAPPTITSRRRTAITAAASRAAGQTFTQVAVASRIDASSGRPTSHSEPASASDTVTPSIRYIPTPTEPSKVAGPPCPRRATEMSCSTTVCTARMRRDSRM